MRFLFLKPILFCVALFCSSILVVDAASLSIQKQQAQATAQQFIKQTLGDDAPYSIVKQGMKKGYYVFTVDLSSTGLKQEKNLEKQVGCEGSDTNASCATIILKGKEIIYSTIDLIKKDQYGNFNGPSVGSLYKITKDGVVFSYARGGGESCSAGGTRYFHYFHFATKKELYSAKNSSYNGVSPVKGDYDCLSNKTVWTTKNTYHFFSSLTDMQTNKNPLSLKATTLEQAFYELYPTAKPVLKKQGFIEGGMGYPSEYIPSYAIACAENIATKETFCTKEHRKGTQYTYGIGYRIAVPDGSYKVYQMLDATHPEAKELMSLNGGINHKGYYTKFLQCTLKKDNQNCERTLDPLIVTVGSGSMRVDGKQVTDVFVSL